MSLFTEISNIRKDGKLDEAYALAKANLPEIYPPEEPLDEFDRQLIEAVPVDIWVRRAMAWVLYDYLKANAVADKADAFISYLEELNRLQLPEDEKMVFDTVAYQVAKVLYALKKQEPVNIGKINRIFEEVRSYHFSRGSKEYSVLLQAFLKNSESWDGLLEFLSWWGLEHLREEDFQSEEYKGKMPPSLEEKAFMAHAKALLTATETSSSKEKMKTFLPQLDTHIKEYPQFKYLPYYKAKLLLATGDEGEAFKAFLPFDRKKKNDFWVWELMAEVQQEAEIKIACYCKALSLNTPEDFLVKTRMHFAELLIREGYYPEAKKEIAKLVEVRQQNEWKIPAKVQGWQKAEWYSHTEISSADNRGFYRKHTDQATNLLYSEIPEETVVVEFVNSVKKMLNFIAPGKKRGFFKYQALNSKPGIGDVLKVRFGKVDGEFYKMDTVRFSDEQPPAELIKSVTGHIRIPEGKDFGFLEDVFIDPVTVKKNELQNGQLLSAKAIQSFNRKKEEWGWKMMDVWVDSKK